jgi:hypothetical protein
MLSKVQMPNYNSLPINTGELLYAL